MSDTPGTARRALWWDDAQGALGLLDQTALPHEIKLLSLSRLDEVCEAIRTMRVRGAPLIGIAGAFGLAVALREDASDAAEERAANALLATRPTAVNLAWAIRRTRAALRPGLSGDAGTQAVRGAQAAWGWRAARALEEARAILADEVATCSRIGDHGLEILRELAQRKASRPGGAGTADAPDRLDVLTHCNAGWLATGGWGTALAPVYKAHEAGVPVHVWVDETRPRGQGASLTAWELGQAGIPHTLIADTAAGHMIQRGRVDVAIVGSDRTTAGGDVCNKIGTYLVALAAHVGGVPFYAAVPTSSIDWEIEDGLAAIPIEERDPSEVRRMRGRTPGGEMAAIELAPAGPAAANPAFDVTPGRFVTGILTEHGVFRATREGLLPLRALVESASRP